MALKQNLSKRARENPKWHQVWIKRVLSSITCLKFPRTTRKCWASLARLMTATIFTPEVLFEKFTLIAEL